MTGGTTTGRGTTTMRTVSRSESTLVRGVEATIWAIPAATAVTTPSDVTATVVAASERHTTGAPGTRSPRWSFTVALSARLALGWSVSSVGVASMAVAMRGRTVSGTEVRACWPNAVAINVASPTPIALTLPLASTVATSELVELQTISVGSAAHRLEALALTCPSTPMSRVRFAGVGVSTRTGSMMPSQDTPLPLPHAARSTPQTNKRRVRGLRTACITARGKKFIAIMRAAPDWMKPPTRVAHVARH